MPDYCADSRSAARHHILQGSPAAFGAVAGFAAGSELISKSSEIRAEFRKSECLYPPKVHKKGPIGLSSLSWRLRD